MAQAIFHSLRGEKSALVLVRPNAFQLGYTPVYLSRKPFENYKEGDSVEIPEGFRIVPLTSSDGEVRKTESGEILKTLVW